MKMWCFVIVLGVSGLAVADDCSDLARSFADAPGNMRVGDLLQLQSCIADRMQQKAQSTPAHGDDVSPSLNIQLQPNASKQGVGASLPAPGLVDH